jgi:hypothetical protein
MSAPNKIEPPHIVSTKKEGLKVIADVLNGLDAMRQRTAPLCGLLYLKFNTETEMDDWISSFKDISNHYWRQKMRNEDDLYFICCSRENDRTLCDVFFAETLENVKTVARMRFPEMEF